MEKPIVVLDYSVDGLSGQLISRWLKTPSTIIKIKEREPFPSIVPGDFRAGIHSGSALSILSMTAFMNGAADFIRKAADSGIPQMGICYGHQLLARAVLGLEAVARCSTVELGWLDVDFLPSWPVAGLSGKKAVWQSHYDCIVNLPSGSVITATNQHTEIQAFFNRDIKLFGTQFHPEFDREAGNRCFANDPDIFRKNSIDLNRTLASGPGFNTGEIIFGHFVKTFKEEG
jgi:GMP synthase-like glutamine amidotransferase